VTGVTPAGPVNARYLQIRPTGHCYRSARRTVLWKRMAIDGERERNCDPAQFINACGARCAEQRNTKNACGGIRSKFWTRLGKRGFRVLRGKSGRSVAHNCSIRFDSCRASVTMALCDRAGTPRRFNRTVRMAMVRDGVTWRAPCNLPGESRHKLLGRRLTFNTCETRDWTKTPPASADFGHGPPRGDR